MTYQVRNSALCGDDWCDAKKEIEALRKQVSIADESAYRATEERDELRHMVAELTEQNKCGDEIIKNFDEQNTNLQMQVAELKKELDTLNAALAAKITICGDTSLAAAQARILELCALLEKAEEALDMLDYGTRYAEANEALAAIKQWKEDV